MHTCVNVVTLVQIASYMELIDTSIHALPNIPGLSDIFQDILNDASFNLTNRKSATLIM